MTYVTIEDAELLRECSKIEQQLLYPNARFPERVVSEQFCTFRWFPEWWLTTPAAFDAVRSISQPGEELVAACFSGDDVYRISLGQFRHGVDWNRWVFDIGPKARSWSLDKTFIYGFGGQIEWYADFDSPTIVGSVNAVRFPDVVQEKMLSIEDLRAECIDNYFLGDPHPIQMLEIVMKNYSLLRSID